MNLADIKAPSGVSRFTLSGQTKFSYRNQPQVAEHYKTKLQEAEAQWAKVQDLVKTEQGKAQDPGSKPDKRKEAEARLISAQDQLKEAEAIQKKAAEESIVAEERAKPRDVELTVYSAPISLVITPETKKEDTP